MIRLIIAVFIFLFASPVFADAPSLTIGSITGVQGQSISVPITADIATAIIADQFDVQYDSALLTFTGMTAGSSNPAWIVVSNNPKPGKIRVGMYNTASIVGNGQQVAVLKFTVTLPVAGAKLLAVPNLILSNAFFNEDSVTTLVNGTFALKMLGDVDGNGKIEAADASMVAQNSLELIVLTEDQIQAADVSGNSKVTVYDAALIAQYAKGIIKKFR